MLLDILYMPGARRSWPVISGAKISRPDSCEIQFMIRASRIPVNGIATLQQGGLIVLKQRQLAFMSRFLIITPSQAFLLPFPPACLSPPCLHTITLLASSSSLVSLSTYPCSHNHTLFPLPPSPSQSLQTSLALAYLSYVSSSPR